MEYKEVCPECNGIGDIYVYREYYGHVSVRRTCFVCNGNKEISWIDKIKGIRYYPNYSEIVHIYDVLMFSKHEKIVKFKGVWFTIE